MFFSYSYEALRAYIHVLNDSNSLSRDIIVPKYFLHYMPVNAMKCVFGVNEIENY